MANNIAPHRPMMHPVHSIASIMLSSSVMPPDVHPETRPASPRSIFDSSSRPVPHRVFLHRDAAASATCTQGWRRRNVESHRPAARPSPFLRHADQPSVPTSIELPNVLFHDFSERFIKLKRSMN